MGRIEAGTAICAVCHEAIQPGADAVVTPDFLADEADPFFRFSDASMHRVCFVHWERRKAFIAHFNRIARRLLAGEGTYPHMTAEGELVQRTSRPPRRSRRERRMQ